MWEIAQTKAGRDSAQLTHKSHIQIHRYFLMYINKLCFDIKKFYVNVEDKHENM